MLIQNSLKGKMQVLIIIIIIIMMMMMITIFNQNTDELGKLITKVCMNN